MSQVGYIKARCTACRRARSGAVAGIILAALLVFVSLALGACSLDTERLSAARQDIATICEGAVTKPVQRWCAAIYIPAVPKEEPEG